MIDRQQSDNFTFLRLLLAILVLFSHSYALIGLPEPNVFGRTLGNFGVHGFFALSGYLVSGSFASTTPLGFTLRRALRLVPGYLAGTVIGLLAQHLYSYYPGNPVPAIANGSLWTLNWEILLYVGVLLFGVLGLLTSQVLGSLMAVSILLVCIHLTDANNGIDVIAPLAILFLVGAFIRASAGLATKRIGLVSLVFLALAFGPWSSALVLGLFDSQPFVFGWGASGYEVRYLLYLVALPFALIYIGRHFPISLPVADDYSYGIYVYAWPCQQVVIHYMVGAGWQLSPLPVFVLAGAPTIALAVVSWHLLERPALALKRWTPSTTQ